MKPVLYFIFILLMLVGSCFGLYKLFSDKSGFLLKFPKLTEGNYIILQILPMINIAALAGLLFFKKWAVPLAITGALAVIAADIYFEIYYHLYLSVSFTVLLLVLVLKFRSRFK